MQKKEQLRAVRGSQSPLISADELEGVLAQPSVKLFDVRGTWNTPARALPEEYGAGHIPGAMFLDWTKHFIEQGVAPGLASVCDRSGAQRAFATLGIRDGDLVVLYDDSSHMQAGRIWLAMRHWGFPNVRVLNGGWSYWKSHDRAISTDVPERTIGTFEPVAQSDLKIDLNDFLESRGQSCVIDARGPIGFAGKRDDPRSGHIPGSINVPFSSVLDPDTGLYLSSQSISQVLDEKAPQWRERPVIASCGSGYAATVILLALAEMGKTARLFDGSFAIWKQDPNRPVQQGATA